MRRRDFPFVIGSAAIAWPLTARAQQVGAVRRVAILLALPKDHPGSQLGLGREWRNLAGLKEKMFAMRFNRLGKAAASLNL